MAEKRQLHLTMSSVEHSRITDNALAWHKSSVVTDDVKDLDPKKLHELARIRTAYVLFFATNTHTSLYASYAQIEEAQDIAKAKEDEANALREKVFDLEDVHLALTPEQQARLTAAAVEWKQSEWATDDVKAFNVDKVEHVRQIRTAYVAYFGFSALKSIRESQTLLDKNRELTEINGKVEAVNADLQQEVSKLKASVESAANNKKNLQEIIDTANANYAILREQADELEADLASQKASVQSLTAEKQELNADNFQIRRRLQIALTSAAGVIGEVEKIPRFIRKLFTRLKSDVRIAQLKALLAEQQEQDEQKQADA